MRHLLLLVAMVAAGQTSGVLVDDGGWPIQGFRCYGRDSSGFCLKYVTERVPLPYSYRIDWLRPDLYLWPYSTNYNIGTPAYQWGHEGFAQIYIQAPLRSVVILLPNGKRVTISRAEIDGRAK